MEHENELGKCKSFATPASRTNHCKLTVHGLNCQIVLEQKKDWNNLLLTLDIEGIEGKMHISIPL